MEDLTPRESRAMAALMERLPSNVSKQIQLDIMGGMEAKAAVAKALAR